MATRAGLERVAHSAPRASLRLGGWLLLVLATACGGPTGAGAGGEESAQIAVLELPLQSTDPTGRTFRLTGTLTVSGPESSTTTIALDDATAADPVLTLWPRTGSYDVTLAAWSVHEWDAGSARFVLRADATPSSALSQQIEVLPGAVSVVRFAFSVPLDIDECALGTDTCAAVASCMNTPGSFECLCPDGWLDVGGDGHACQHVRDIAAASQRACAIVESGALYCWGENSSRELGDGTFTDRSTPVRIGTDSDWRRIAAGDDASCGIKAGGELWCWGGTHSGHGTSQAVPARVGGFDDWSFVASFATNTCAIRGAGELYCWGNNGAGQVGIGSTTPSSVPTPTRAGTLDGFTRVAMGNSGQTCAVRNNGELYCWGYNGGYQVGDGTNVNVLSPKLIDAGGWTEVAGGQLNTCGVKNGELFCWGADGYGVLGDGAYGGPTATSPQRVGAASDWSELAMGHYHVCGLRSGELYCWGYGGLGQLGSGAPLSSAVPQRAGTASDWTQITANRQLTCGVRDGEAYCWGENSYGTLGIGVGPTAVSPKLISADAGWSEVAAGYRFNCGVRAGALWCWGEGTSGKLGTGSTLDVLYPTQVGTATDWSGVAAGTSHACGIRNGELYCWGSNGNGRLGDGVGTSRSVPQQVVTPADLVATTQGWSRVTTGSSHTCGINNGALYCWGNNSSGQRGDGNQALAAVAPLRIGSDTDWAEIAADSDNTCGLRGDQLYCWGAQVVGVQYTLTPTLIAGSWSQISPGTTLCGIRSGELYCWGQAYLGNGTAGASDTPVRIGTDSDWLRVTTAQSYACGVRTDGTYCWGANSVGQLGDGTQTLRTAPSLVTTATDWSTLVAASGAHVCGVRPGLGVLCWGADEFSQLGDGYAVINPTPQLVALP